MESIEKTYREMSILKAKYDHLFIVCTNLLKSWHNRDHTGKLVSDEKHKRKVEEPLPNATEQIASSKLYSSDIQEVDKAMEEMQLLEAALQKAKKVRTSPLHKVKRHVPSKSAQQAEKVYKQPSSLSGRPARASGSTSKASLKATDNGRKGKSSSSARMAARSVKHVASDKPKHLLLSDKDMDSIPAKSSTPSIPSGSGPSDNEQDLSFNIRQHGVKLKMPARYWRIQQALTQLEEEVVKQEHYSIGGQHFCRRLNSQIAPDTMQVADTIVLLEELEWLKEKVLSLTQRELTVNERSPWEEVWKVKSKLEALTEHAQKIRDGHTQDKSNSDGSTGDYSAATVASHQDVAYKSLKEWESMATTELELLVSKQELQLVQFISDKLLPLLPVANCPTHIMQTIYELVGLKKPIYVKI